MVGCPSCTLVQALVGGQAAARSHPLNLCDPTQPSQQNLQPLYMCDVIGIRGSPRGQLHPKRSSLTACTPAS
jgi:hypothetical protein